MSGLQETADAGDEQAPELLDRLGDLVPAGAHSTPGGASVLGGRSESPGNGGDVLVDDLAQVTEVVELPEQELHVLVVGAGLRARAARRGSDLGEMAGRDQLLADHLPELLSGAGVGRLFQRVERLVDLIDGAHDLAVQEPDVHLIEPELHLGLAPRGTAGRGRRGHEIVAVLPHQGRQARADGGEGFRPGAAAAELVLDPALSFLARQADGRGGQEAAMPCQPQPLFPAIVELGEQLEKADLGPDTALGRQRRVALVAHQDLARGLQSLADPPSAPVVLLDLREAAAHALAPGDVLVEPEALERRGRRGRG
jgi:hypothetical protein